MQKFFECSEKSFVSKTFEKIRGKIYLIATNSYGTRGFQKMLEYTTSDTDYEILKDFLTSNVFNLIKDVNGNHVVQKIIQIIPANKNSFILNEIIKHIVDISKLKQGSCVFQKVIDKSIDSDKKNLIMMIIKNIDKLINDEFGNFIVQHIVNLKIEEYNNLVFDYVKSNFVTLSKQKYSSNVIDKCILYDDLMLRSVLIDKMLETKCIGELIIDQYGNYGILYYLYF